MTRWWLLLIPLAVGLYVVYIDQYDAPKYYETTCFNSEGKQLYHSIDDYHPHVARFGKVTCIVKGLR